MGGFNAVCRLDPPARGSADDAADRLAWASTCGTRLCRGPGSKPDAGKGSHGRAQCGGAPGSVITASGGAEGAQTRYNSPKMLRTDEIRRTRP